VSAGKPSKAEDQDTGDEIKTIICDVARPCVELDTHAIYSNNYNEKWQY
jgi:hypothetical protein